MVQRVAERIPERRLEPIDINAVQISNGPAAAAFLAAGIGSLALGVATTLAEANAAISSALNLYRPVGPLSGKTMVAVTVWLFSWAVLHFAWRNKQVNFELTFVATLILIALGFLGTFPVFFGMFAQG